MFNDDDSEDNDSHYSDSEDQLISDEDSEHALLHDTEESGDDFSESDHEDEEYRSYSEDSYSSRGSISEDLSSESEAVSYSEPRQYDDLLVWNSSSESECSFPIFVPVKNNDKMLRRNSEQSKHLFAVEKAMKEKGTLKHTLSHGMMVGPARSGKSSLMSRLAGEMPISDSPSTGVAEKVVQVVGIRKSQSVALCVQDTIWYKLLYDQEAIQLMMTLSQNLPPQPQQHEYSSTSTTANASQQIQSTKPTENTSPIVQLSSNSSENYAASYPEGYIPPMEVFKTATEGKALESLRQHFENSWSFYLTDTGGQVEFQEVIPLLVSGPSVFFFTFRLDQDLNQRFTIEYHLPKGGRSKPYQSTLTVVEAILQTLASVASMETFTYKGPQVKNVSLKPKMFIVGTHKDKLNPATAVLEIEKIDQFLQKIIEPTSYYRKDIIQFASENQMIYTVNNFSKDDSDFNNIRLGVERIVCNSRFRNNSEFPTHWLIFSLVLRQKTIKDSIISYEQCFSIAKDCGIKDTEEFDHALWFLHTKIGLIRHFTTPGLQKIVIRDPQILFDVVSKLIVNTFNFENAGKQCSTEFEKKGIFTLDDFLSLQKDSPPLLPPEKLLQLLENLQIIAPFREEGQKKFFIPCVLAHSEECESQSLPQNSDIPPLLITFKCGYSPKGLAGALIVYLLTNKMGSKFEWVLKTDQIFRNQISFIVSSCDIITLKIHPTFLELIHSSTKSIAECMERATKLCSMVYNCIESGINSVSAEMHLKTDHSPTFYCQNIDCITKCGNHPATAIVTDEDDTKSLLCMHLSESKNTSDLPQGSSIWFGNKARESEVQSDLVDPISKNSCFNTRTHRHHADNNKLSLKKTLEILLPLACDWENIGVFLEVPDSDLKPIKKENSEVRDCLREMLRKWLSQVDPLPTWSSLAKAVEPLNPSIAEEIKQKYCSSWVKKQPKRTTRQLDHKNASGMQDLHCSSPKKPKYAE